MSDINPQNNRIKITEVEGKVHQVETKFDGAIEAMKTASENTTKATDRIEKNIEDFINKTGDAIGNLSSRQGKLDKRITKNETNIGVARWILRTVITGIIGIIVWLVQQHIGN